MTYFSPIWVFNKTVGRIVCANCGIKCQACDHRFNKKKNVTQTKKFKNENIRNN